MFVNSIVCHDQHANLQGGNHLRSFSRCLHRRCKWSEVKKQLFTKAENSFSRFLYEDHPQFCPLPTFGVIPAMSGTDGLVTGGVPGLEIDLTQVLKTKKLCSTL